MRFLLSKRIYFILAVILLLVFALELTRSEFILQWSLDERSMETVKAQPTVDALSPEQVGRIKENQYQWTIVYDADSEYSMDLTSNAAMVLKNMKQNASAVKYQDFELPGPEHSAVILAITDLSRLMAAETIIHYAEQGGSVFFLSAPERNDSFYRLYRKLGIIELGGIKQAQGIKLVSNVLLGSNGDEYTGNFIANGIQVVRLEPAAKVLATTPDGIPMMWEKQLGSGKFMMFNGTMLQEKANRGIIAGGISLLMPDFIYPVINAKIMYIDDFPAPVSQETDARLYREYRRDIPKFYRDVWWPDMVQLASRHNLKYTAVVIQSYGDKVTGPFDGPDAMPDLLIMYGREVLKNNGEIGIHGYNHQSLHTDPGVMKEFGYNVWQSAGDITSSIAAVREFIKKGFPWYTAVSYVPPSNVLSELGREALKQGLPELDNIGSVYTGDGALNYVQEFEVAEDGIVEMPRISSGYRDGGELRWASANAVNTVGVFSHFVHPDDVLNEQRSFGGLGWQTLYDNLGKYLGFIDSRYSWLRSLTAKDASYALRQWFQSEVYIERDGESLNGYINRFGGEQYFIFRTEKKIGSTKRCTVKKIDENTYLVHVTGEKFVIGLGRTS